MRRIALFVTGVVAVSTVAFSTPGAVAAEVAGPLIAFSSDRDGNFDVYVIAAAGGTPVNLTTDPGSDTSPTWSPDGRRIAFVSDRSDNPDIWIMDADGDNPVNLTASAANEGGPAWSPDGTQIAYSASLQIQRPDGSFDTVLPSSIFVFDVETRIETRLTVPELGPLDPEYARNPADGQPAWSPDGRTVAFVRNYTGLSPMAQVTRFFTVPSDGGEDETPIGGGSWSVRGLAWSPDGGSMVFGSVVAMNTSASLRRLDVATGTQAPIDVPLDFTHYERPALSTDGATLAFIAYTLNRDYAEVYVWQPGGSEPPRRLTSDPGWDTEPAWQPWYPSVGLVDPDTGRWTLRDRAVETAFYYGDPGDYPIVGDWDCDGVATPGLYRQSDGYVYLRNSNTQGVADRMFFFGDPGDLPLAGDFNGDGCDTVSIYRSSEQRFYIINRLGENGGGLGAADHWFVFGNPGDRPVAGDWDGDGVDEIGLHRESTGLFYYRNTLTTGVADGEFFFGDPGDRFVAGEWGAVDGRDTPALFRPADITFYFRYSLTQGVADSQLTWAGAGSDWIPVAGDFNLDQ